jgi:uncharacterized membrane protein YhaH (DUF805 family)
MRRKLAVLAVSFIIIFLPVMLIGLMMSVNEYQDQGISGAVDCNGPLTVMLFIVPSLMVYAGGAVYYAVLLRSSLRQRLLTALLLVLCVVMVFAAGRKAWAAYSERSRPEHQETCGEGW